MYVSTFVVSQRNLSIHVWLALHEFAEIAKQHVSETQTLMEREAQHVNYQQKELHRKKEATKDRTQATLAGRQKVNEMTKKFMKTE